MIDEAKLHEHMQKLAAELSVRVTAVDRNSQVWYAGYTEALRDVQRFMDGLKPPATPSKKA